MARKNLRIASSKINLHEVARLSPEEIDCLLNPSEDNIETTLRDETNVKKPDTANSSFANHFASALSFCLSTQFEALVSVEVTQTCLSNLRYAIEPKYNGFTKLLFQNSDQEVVSALLISHELLDSTSGEETVYRNKDSDDLNAIGAFKSFSALMGKGVDLVSETLTENPASLTLSENEVLKIDLQITSLSRVHPAVGLISPISL